MPYRLLPLILLVSACVAAPDDIDMPTVEPDPDSVQIHSFTIDRAYSLTDPRELAFRDQIAAEARAYCVTGDYSLYSSRPIGVEVVRDDFLYRQYAIEITCDR